MMIKNWNLDDFAWEVETTSAECYGVWPPDDFINR